MKKTIICVLSILGGIMVIAAALCVILAIINYVSYGNAVWLGLLAAPAVLWMPIKGIFGGCDKMNETEEKTHYDPK